MFFLLFSLFLLSSEPVSGEGLAMNNVPYYESEFNDSEVYKRELAVLDVYCPSGTAELKSTLVWFLEGGLIRGSEYVPAGLKN